MRALIGCLLLVVLQPCAGTGSTEITEAEFRRLHAQIRPPKGALWRSVPWKLSLIDAQQIAAAKQKPLFIWAMDGHPLGCT